MLIPGRTFLNISLFRDDGEVNCRYANKEEAEKENIAKIPVDKKVKNLNHIKTVPMKGTKVKKTATVKPKVTTEKVYGHTNTDGLPEKIFVMSAPDPVPPNFMTSNSETKGNPVKSNHLSEAISAQSASNEGITAKKIVKKQCETAKNKNKCDKNKTVTASSNKEKESSSKIDSSNKEKDNRSKNDSENGSSKIDSKKTVLGDKDNNTDVYKEEIIGDHFIIHIYTGEEPDDYDINDLIKEIEKQEEALGFYRYDTCAFISIFAFLRWTTYQIYLNGISRPTPACPKIHRSVQILALIKPIGLSSTSNAQKYVGGVQIFFLVFMVPERPIGLISTKSEHFGIFRDTLAHPSSISHDEI